VVEYGGGCSALCEGQPEEEVPLASKRALALLKVNKTIGTAKKNQQIITISRCVCDSHIVIIYARIRVRYKSINEGIQTISGQGNMNE